jgi:ribosomal protein L24E
MGREFFSVRNQAGRIFFFLKKKEAKKTSFICKRKPPRPADWAERGGEAASEKSFLVLFFKKEQLPRSLRES